MGAKTGLYKTKSSIKRVGGAYGQSTRWGIYDEKGISPTLTKAMGDGGGHVPMIYKSNTNANMKQRIQNRDATWTLTSSNNDFGLMDGCRIRRLTPTECERLQGFPDGYTNGISDTQRYKCLGNAVTVNTIQYIGSFLNG